MIDNSDICRKCCILIKTMRSKVKCNLLKFWGIPSKTLLYDLAFFFTCLKQNIWQSLKISQNFHIHSY